MPKGPYLIPKIKDILAQIYFDDRKIGPTKAREKLLKRMRAVGLDEIFGSDYPKISTVSKELKELRLKDEARLLESKGLDEPWSLGSLKEYDIPAEALPIVMAAFMRTITIVPTGAGEQISQGQKEELTIREAKWIARLYKVVDGSDLVRDWAWLYAQQEWIAEVTGRPFISWELDVELVRNPQYARDTRRDFEREIAIWDIAEKYNADPVKLKDLNLSIEETEEIAKSGKYKKEAQSERKYKAKKQE